MTLHIIIKQERRSPPRQLAQEVNADTVTPTGKLDKNGIPIVTVTPQPPQLHTMGERIDDMSNIAYAAEWDGISPYLEVAVGDIADLKRAYMGWPMVTKEEREAAQPKSSQWQA